jgi:DNA modification methylase
MSESDPYLDFLRRKIRLAPKSGFEVADSDLSPMLLGHQRAIVRWAARGGRRAIFARFGLGKSVMQIELLRLATSRFGGRGLIVAPYGVHGDIIRDAEMLGVTIRAIRRIEDCDETGLYLTNYEPVRDGKIDPNQFLAVSLDEASVLRSYGSKTFQTFLGLFSAVRFRFVATATPSPNRYKELIHYAGFLGVMDTGQALTRFFQRDSTKANNLTLYPHKEREFWLWIGSWAVFLERPSDLGFSDAGYDLPPIDLVVHEVSTTVDGYRFERDGQGQLLDEAGGDLGQTARARRASLDRRVAKVAEIVAASPDDHFLIWHDLEDERRAIEKAVPGVVSVYGTQDLDERRDIMRDFADGRRKRLSTKPIIAGSGPNFQRHCHREIFCGVSQKFNDFIQAVHRVQRFQQPRRVRVDVIFADTERHVWRDLLAKWKRDTELRQTMTEIVRTYGLNDVAMSETLARTIGVERVEAAGEGWLVANNDTVDEARRLEDDSIDLIVTSIPFANHYEYTPSYNDFGHTDDNRHFWEQMDFLTPQLRRALKPGRVAAIHVKDRVLFGSVTGEGVPTLSPFHCETIEHYRRHGFQYMALITIATDVVRENNQTYRLGYSEMLKDATKMGVGCPEYVVVMRKPQSDRGRGYADAPVTRGREDYSLARWQVDAHAFWRSSGERLATPEELSRVDPGTLAKLFTRWTLEGLYDYEAHVRIGEALEGRGALPSTFMALAPGSHHPDVWHDVNRMRTLNGAQSASGREQHVCPLQFDIVDRLIRRYSDEGDLVYDPFGGLFTVPYRALHLKRRGRAVELSSTYFLDGVKYLQAAERQIGAPSLFDLLQEIEPGRAA